MKSTQPLGKKYNGRKKEYYTKEEIKAVADTLKANNGSWPCGNCKVPCTTSRRTTRWIPNQNRLVSEYEYRHEGFINGGLEIYHKFLPDDLLLAARELIENENNNNKKVC